MRVSVGGVVLGNVSVSTASYAAYTFPFTAVSGAKDLKVEFTNDFHQNGEDRNLFVDRVEVGCWA